MWRSVAARLTRPEIEPAALQSYRHEQRTQLVLPIVTALMEGGFIGVIADKMYHVHPVIEAPLIYLVSHQLQASYTTSIALTLAIPLGFSLLTLPLWAAYLDRVHISEFRARHSWVWVLAQAVTWFGAIRGSLVWIGLGRLLLGMGRGGAPSPGSWATTISPGPRTSGSTWGST